MGYPSSYFIFFAEQSLMMLHQKPRARQVHIATLSSMQWNILTGKQKIVYEAVAKRVREQPVRGINFKTFEGIQKYKRIIGFPCLELEALEPVEQPLQPVDSDEEDPLFI